MKLFKLLSKKKNKSFALPVKADYKYHAENLPRLLETYNVFTPAFLSLLSARYLNEGKSSNFTDSDLLDGVTPSYAFWVLNHCTRLVDARYKTLRTLNDAKKAEVRFIDFEVFRACPGCSKIPKNKRYKISANIPIYPCEDCQEDNICIFAYNLCW